MITEISKIESNELEPIKGKYEERTEPFPSKEEYKAMLEMSALMNRYTLERVLDLMRQKKS